jgi:flagellin FlaB
MRVKKILRKFLKQKRGMVGIEAAIVLISFVIVAAAFSFMVVNMGLFSTQRGRETIQNSILEANSPLIVDGTINIRANSSKVDAMVIPLKTLGVSYVPMAEGSTEITLRVENHTAIADIYNGIDDTSPNGSNLDTLVTAVGSSTAAKLFLGNNDGDSSLDYSEKGFLVFYFAVSDRAAEGEHIFVEIRPEKGAPTSIEFVVIQQITEGWFAIGG